MNEEKILDAIIQKIYRDYPNDISILAVYGSYLSSSYDEFSDIDFYFIPKTERGFDLSIQFILNDIGYDLWPFPWERVEKITTLEDHRLSILLDTRVLYYNEAADLAKFEAAQQQARKVLTDSSFITNRVEKLLNEVKVNLFQITQEGKNYQETALFMLEKICVALAFLNGTYFKKGLAHIESEVLSFKILPDDFSHKWPTVLDFNHVENAIQQLISLAKSVENLRQQKDISQIEFCPQNLPGFYEELKSTYNKIYRACSTQNRLEGLIAANQIDKEVRQILHDNYQEILFPKLTDIAAGGDFDKLLKSTQAHENQLVGIYRQYNVPIVTYENIDTFVKFMAINNCY